MNDQKWRETGRQSKKVREELFKLKRMVSGKIPVSIVKHVVNAIDDVDRFRNIAEERMLNSGGPSDLSIFYGQEKEKEKDGPEYLWDLNLEEIPLGWDERYQQELKENPEGRYEIIPDFPTESAEYKVFYHPVGYREKLLSLFKDIQEKAKKIFQNDEDFKTKMHTLLKMDIALYNILDEWVTDDFWDVSCMDPFKIEDVIKISSGYFTESYSQKAMERYKNLKLINLSVV